VRHRNGGTRTGSRWIPIADFVVSKGIAGVTTAGILQHFQFSPRIANSVGSGLSQMANRNHCDRWGLCAVKFGSPQRGRWLFLARPLYGQFIRQVRTCFQCERELPITMFAILEKSAQVESTCAACTPMHPGTRSISGHALNDHDYRRPRPKVKHCEECCGIPERRPKDGPCACGRLWAPDLPPKEYEQRDYSRCVAP
jgi:hypothetical protein